MNTVYLRLSGIPVSRELAGAISSELRLQELTYDAPEHAWMATSTPRSGVKQSWTGFCPAARELGVAEQMDLILERLCDRQAFVTSLGGRGCKAEFACYTVADGLTGAFSLTARQISLMARLPASLFVRFTAGRLLRQGPKA